MAGPVGLPPIPPHITVTTYTDWPYTNYEEVNGKLVGRGIAFEIMDLLMKKFNFTYSIKLPEKNIIGNNETGMLSLLYKKEVDMAVAFIPILSELDPYCDFSTALDEMDTTFLLERPGTSYTGSGLFAPFSQTVWHYIFGFMFVVGPTVWLFTRLRQLFTKDRGAEKFTFFTCMWFAYAALLKQGTTSSPVGDSVRLVFASWWIFITILSAFYTANLTALLTISRYTIGLNSIDALVDSGESWFVSHGRSVQTLLHYDYPEVKDLNYWSNYGFVSYDYNMTYKNMLKMVKGGRVYIADRVLASLAILEDYRNRTRDSVDVEKRCPYIISYATHILPKRRGFAFPKNSLLLKQLEDELMTIVERGLVDHFKSELLPEAPTCPLNLKSLERQLRVPDLLLTGKVMKWGYSIALGVLILEIIAKLFEKCLNSDCVRRCCNREIKGTEAPVIEAWEYWRKDDPNFSWIRTPPPVYEANGGVNNNYNGPEQYQEEYSSHQKTYNINGRDYYIVKEETGNQRLVPIRTPSAYLFQYIH